MKKWITLFLCAILVLSLSGCTEEAKLYEKHAEVIDLLEMKDYYGAIAKITGMIYAEQNAGVERPAPVKVISDTWHTVTDSVVSTVEFREDNTCTVDGNAYSWLERYSDEESLEGYIMDGGAYKYYFYFSTNRSGFEIPGLSLSTCRIDGENVYSDQSVGTYRNHAQIRLPMKSWQRLEGPKTMAGSFAFNNYTVYLNGNEYYWQISSEAGVLPMTIQLTARNDGVDEISMCLYERDGHYVLDVENVTKKETALYYCEDYGFEKTWPEYIYPIVVRYLKNYVNGSSFKPEGYEEYLRDHAALKYLQEQFTILGDYKESAQYLSRISVLPSMLTEVVQQTTDQLNNVNNNALERYAYDVDGRRIQGYGPQMMETYGVYETWSNYNFEFDGKNNVNRIVIGNNEGICTPTYNAAGNLESMHVQRTNKQYTSTYTYDDQGRLAQVVIPAGSVYDTYVYTYTYDDAGHVIQSTKSWDDNYYQRVYDYTYAGDAVVQMVESVMTRQDLKYTITYDYTNDAQGRHERAVVTSTDPGVTYKERVIVYVYEDLYYLDTDGLVLPED